MSHNTVTHDRHAHLDARRGALSATAAYAWWGLFPLYFKAMASVPALEMLAHRMAWSLVFIAIVLALKGHWRWLGEVRHTPRLIGIFAASAITLAINWLVYIWAVQQGHVIEGSLGYFINPLVNVIVGAVVLRERLRTGQWAAVALATLGVLWLTWVAGRPPWIALTLALTFSAYGLQRKLAPLGALEGLAMETLVLSPLALTALGWWAWNDMAMFARASWPVLIGMVAAGPITAIPLLMFAYGARRIPFSVLGLLQYIGPTLQLMCGVWWLHEPFESPRAIGFAMIWLALAMYSAEGWWQSRR